MSSSDSESSDEEHPVTKRRRTSSSSEDERPSLGVGGGAGGGSSIGSMFVSGGKESMAFNSAADESKHETQKKPPPPAAQPSQSHASTYGIGAKLMSKMGYVAGKGLGQEGKGIVNPVEQKLRPTGLGLGGISEKPGTGSKPKKPKKMKSVKIQEPKEQAAKEQTPKKPRNVFKTISEMENEGLRMPAGFKEIIDMTAAGKGQAKSDLGFVKSEKIAVNDPSLALDKSRGNLEKLAAEWDDAKEQQAKLSKEAEELTKRVDSLKADEERIQKLVQELQKLNDPEYDVEQTLLSVQRDHGKDVEQFGLDDAAVAALEPGFREHVKEWDPLKSPQGYKSKFLDLKVLLRIDDDKSVFHALINQVWLPAVQSRLMEDWQPSTDPYSAIVFYNEWEPLLSAYNRDAFFHRVILPKLKREVDRWNPTSRTNEHTDAAPPHQWLFPWLPHLDTALDEVLQVVKQKFTKLLTYWDPEDDSLAEDLSKWRELFGHAATEKLMSTYLLPRLNEYLRRNFVVNPAQQDVEPLNHVLKWKDCLDKSTLGLVLAQHFFPKWLDVLWQWLTADAAKLDELADWLQHWYDNFFPADVVEIPQVSEGFKRAFDLCNEALDLGKDRRKLAHPVKAKQQAPTKTVQSQSAKRNAEGPQPVKRRDTSFKQVVEAACDEHGYLLKPSEDFDDKFGQRLMRISASASGKGGVYAVIYKDVLYVKRRPRDEFKPVDLDSLSEFVE